MYSIKEINDKKVWDVFVDEQKSSTFMHSFAWGEAEKALGKKVFRFGIFKTQDTKASHRPIDMSDTQVGAAQVVLLRARRGTLLLCPHGPIIAMTEQGTELIDILSVLKTHLVTLGKSEKCDAIRISPILFSNEHNRQAFKNLGFRKAPIHVYPELSWILDISVSEDTLLLGMKKNTRYGIRKAEKDGITVSSTANLKDFETFWNIYADTAKRQSFVPHPKKFVQAEYEHFAAEDRARVYFAHCKGEIISTAMIIYSSYSAFYHHGASKIHSGITPGELLQWQVIRDAKARGLTKYNFWGVVPEGKKDHAWARLDKFKKGFGGFEEMYVPTQDYRLSPKYLLTYMIESVRRIKRRV